jgi:hypothetical protein
MVPLDGSEQAEQALGVADQLARLYRRPVVLGNVCIHLVRVLDLMPALPWGPYPFGMPSVPDAVLESETQTPRGRGRHGTDYP